VHENRVLVLRRLEEVRDEIQKRALGRVRKALNGLQRVNRSISDKLGASGGQPWRRPLEDDVKVLEGLLQNAPDVIDVDVGASGDDSGECWGEIGAVIIGGHKDQIGEIIAFDRSPDALPSTVDAQRRHLGLDESRNGGRQRIGNLAQLQIGDAKNVCRARNRLQHGVA
jgi:hypothetical protein